MPDTVPFFWEPENCTGAGHEWIFRYCAECRHRREFWRVSGIRYRCTECGATQEFPDEAHARDDLLPRE